MQGFAGNLAVKVWWLKVAPKSQLWSYRTVEAVNNALNKAAEEDKLTWDISKETGLDFHQPLKNKPTSATTFGIHLRSDLSFKENIRKSTEKAIRLLKVLQTLGNSNGGMSPKAFRALYTGAIRPIFTWGSELWNRASVEVEKELGMIKRAEYQALRKITGGYNGSSHDKLLAIAHIEPLQTKLDDISACWAARSLRTGDIHIRKILETPPPPHTALAMVGGPHSPGRDPTP